MLTEEMMKTVFTNTTKKVRELQCTLSMPQNHYIFSMEEIKALSTVIIWAGRDRDKFMKLKNLLDVRDSKPIYKIVMSLNRFTCFLRYIRFNN